MEKNYKSLQFETILYNFWEKNNYFKNIKGKPYTILMPPPNANASLHAGHGMYVVDDIITRWKIINGFNASWIPGRDHAGFETQYVYEKALAKQDRSRLDFDRQTLYNDIYKFVANNSDLIFKQFKRLGFIADWGKSVFTLDKHVVDYVFETFKKMHDDKLVYRSEYIVNYCVHCGTSLSELEVKYIERTDPLYYIKYGPFVLATVRPETKFGDTALAVHPQDKRYQKWVGQTIEVEGLLGEFKIKVIADDYVDPKFGTGVVKITPAHDPNDFQIGLRHNLEIKQVIDLNGRLTESAGIYSGMKVKVARAKIVEDLKNKGLMEKIDENYNHSVTVCYKCGRDLEPMIVPNWFIKVKDLKKPVIEAITKNKIKFYPARFKKQILQWLNVMHDWPISRQIAWGIRIPVWYSIKDNPNLHITFLDKNNQRQTGRVSDLIKQYSFAEIENGLQRLTAAISSNAININYKISSIKPMGEYLQETDTFDTWFSSGQWPLVTGCQLPTDMLGTLSDILPFWVSRMIMFSLYRNNEIPFNNVYLWSMVADRMGQKMSKSRGNVVNPIDLVDKYGADAFRASLVFGASLGGKIILSEDKVRAMRNFVNKIWNIGRFMEMNNNVKIATGSTSPRNDTGIKNLNKEYDMIKKNYQKFMVGYQFSKSFDMLYEFIWHRFADIYIEELKDCVINGNIEVLDNLKSVYFGVLKMLHPYIPFVTEAIWQVFHGKNASILINSKN